MAKSTTTEQNYDLVSDVARKVAEGRRGNLHGWYSNGLTYEKAAGMEHQYARITNATYGLQHNITGGAPKLRLTLDLKYEDGYDGTEAIYAEKDILKLLVLTKSNTLSDLEGKIVDTYFQDMPDGHTELKGISVNENLIHEYLNEEEF